MKIAPDDAFDADSFDKPVIGIAADMGVHDSGRHSHLRHQLLFRRREALRLNWSRPCVCYRHVVRFGSRQARYIAQ